VDKFGTQLDRRAHARQAPRPATAADALARFKNQNLLACAAKLGGGGQSRGTGANDDNLVIQL